MHIYACAYTARETSTSHTKHPHACPPTTHLVYIESFLSQIYDERVWGYWRKKWTKMDVGGGKLVGLVDLPLTILWSKVGSTTKNGGKNG
jgi:hypothetical protein